MGAIYREFEGELGTIAARHRGRPSEEAIALYLVALEREQIVSVSYRDDVIVRRLAELPIPDAVREAIRHALLWVWKDEELHAIYIRGVLLRNGTLRLRLRSLATQLSGAIGGWTGSILHHVRWGDAPLARALAAALTRIGALAGKVPREVAKELVYGSFRHFCLFNVDAERTAALCWKLLAEKAANLPGTAPALLREFRRMWVDEENHALVFEALAAALDEQDRLASPGAGETLAARLRAVGPYFVPRALRRVPAVENPLGAGGRVHVLEGSPGDAKRDVFRRLLDESDLGRRLDDRARFLGKRPGELRVAIKPTFMLGASRRDLSPITDPALLDELGAWLRERGCADVALVESPTLYDRFHGNRSVAEVARHFGIASPHSRVVDLSSEQVPHVYSRGMAHETIGRTWKEADFRLSFAKLRSHSIDLFAFTVANLEGLGPRHDEFLFLDRTTHRQSAIMTLLGDFPVHFALLEGYDSAPDNLMGVMGSRRPRRPRRLYAGADALAVDLVAGRHVGVRDPRRSSVLEAACQWFGDPTGRIEVTGVDRPIRGWRGPALGELSAALSLLAYPVYLLASGRGSLFLPRMDERAFPPVAPEGPLLRVVRRALRSLLGLRP